MIITVKNGTKNSFKVSGTIFLKYFSSFAPTPVATRIGTTDEAYPDLGYTTGIPRKVVL